MSGELAAPPETPAPASVKKCQFWLPNKRRYCANTPRPSSEFCGNHNPSSALNRVPCPIDPSHSVFEESLDSHVRKCPFKKQIEALEAQPYYSKSINSGDSDELTLSSAEKRKAILLLEISDFFNLINKIKSVHSSEVVKFKDSFLVPESCENLLNGQFDRRIPYQEKHVVQQASILGNMKLFGILINQNKKAKKENKSEDILGVERERESNADVAVVEFGAGRGYLTQLLTDCYGINKVFLIERRSYRLKADRSLRQNDSVNLERLRIDIEDLNLSGVDSLKDVPYLATGKHLCGPATDLTINCCIGENGKDKKGQLKGLAIATCCHHLCQWKHYANKKFLSELGIKKEEFHAMSWFSSWAIDGDHTSKEINSENEETLLETFKMKESDCEGGIEKIIRNMPPKERESIGFMCKEIIDAGRLLFLKSNRFDAHLVNYVSKSISPENHLLIGKIEA